MNVGSLFSGIGGLDLGLHRAGHRHVFFCESDEFRRAVLAVRWPGVPIFHDVRKVDAASLRRGRREVAGNGARADAERYGPAPPFQPIDADLLCGGFPCQDVSVAGRRAGLDGARSGLFHEFARIADALRPRFVLVENVPGLLSSNGGRDFGVVLGTLADIGYGLAWRILDSRFFGVPQRRRRVFVVGAVADGDPRAAAERAGQILAVGTRCDRHPATRREARPDIAVASLSGLGTGGPDGDDGQAGRIVANGLVKRYGKGTDSDATDTLIAAPLTKGSATGEGVNQPGRRQEDDVNLVPIAGPLGGGNDGTGRRTEDDPNLVTAFASKGGGGGAFSENGVSPTLSAHGDQEGSQPPALVSTTGVRRLTPTECERLQGFPDGWTQLGDTPDSKRYSALGDAVTVNVAEWIGQRLHNKEAVE